MEEGVDDDATEGKIIFGFFFSFFDRAAWHISGDTRFAAEFG